ncbi:MAG: DUF2092 domain-containing protein [Candidatus Kaistia colombiensis]|nr:MAG: DUF2092 domain-containing protein [Kaistia sp.]
MMKFGSPSHFIPPRYGAGLGLAVLLLAAAPLPIQAKSLHPAAAQAEASLPAIEPASIAALTRMGDHLASLKSFEIDTRSSMEVVDGDQKLSIEGGGTYAVQRPDRLKIDMRTDSLRREFIYDGKTVTYVAPNENFYATFDAPPTIKETLREAAQKYDLAFPLADLFNWGTKDAPIDQIKEGFHVGKAYIGGEETDHWAFRGRDQDWEVWIRTEGTPVPLKLSLVDRLEPTAPRFSVELNWTEAKVFPDDTFTYTPPAGAAKITFAKEGAAQ